MRNATDLRLEIREIASPEELSACYDLRWRILREPWTQSRSSAHDQRESEAINVGCWVGSQLVGTGRLHFNSGEEAQVRFMAVEPGFQGQGIGSALLEELERRAAEAGASRIVLDARESALAFYQRSGYQTLGPAGLLFGKIVHWKMAKRAGA